MSILLAKATLVMVVEINIPMLSYIISRFFYPVLLYRFKFNLVAKDLAIPGEVSFVIMHCNFFFKVKVLQHCLRSQKTIIKRLEIC